ncbi:IclR family transcriptional regulator [Saccharothrix sp. ALI-22-I]|uniref:IclR family transcriptional regulator n=1 Tax=Saccharothrix sp. ALI-22-I TaxID=1933778 RepID=UPI00097BC9E5|nr:IclR family transcriptional regulator [Saccharothrix sp. ALI-22-I]ONI84869.1 IclR family transcriptional regulator [Saccharothrix sp. ALI-22-I]
MAVNSDVPRRSMAGRALALLGTFDGGHPRLKLTELARRADLPLPTVHRLAAELVSWGALERDATGYYSIGLRLWEAATLAPVAGRLREIALPFMQDLYETTRENIHLAVHDGFDALYVEKLSGHRSVPVVSRIGARLPMHSTGVGKALLARADAAFVRAYAERPLPRFTRYTITEHARLLRELRATAERGYALTNEEMTLGTCSVAVAIPSDGYTPAGALGIVVRSVRTDLHRLVPDLRAAAEAIGRKLDEAVDDTQPGRA